MNTFNVEASHNKYTSVNTNNEQTISLETLKVMDKSVKNFNDGHVSNSINLSNF